MGDGDSPVLSDSPTIITETGNNPCNGLERAPSIHFGKNIIPSRLGELAHMVAEYCLWTSWATGSEMVVPRREGCGYPPGSSLQQPLGIKLEQMPVEVNHKIKITPLWCIYIYKALSSSSSHYKSHESGWAAIIESTSQREKLRHSWAKQFESRPVTRIRGERVLLCMCFHIQCFQVVLGALE